VTASGVRVALPDSYAAIDLIDELRARGVDAGLADTPGEWTVAADVPLSAILPVLAARRATRARKRHVRGQTPDVSAGARRRPARVRPGFVKPSN
jgi:hypothetical protein